MTHANANRRDGNEKQIVAVWRALGYALIQLHEGQGADWIVGTPRGLFIVEIKQPWTVNELTPTERRVQAEYNAVCPGSYVVVSTPEDAVTVGRE